MIPSISSSRIPFHALVRLFRPRRVRAQGRRIEMRPTTPMRELQGSRPGQSGPLAEGAPIPPRRGRRAPVPRCREGVWRKMLFICAAPFEEMSAERARQVAGRGFGGAPLFSGF